MEAIIFDGRWSGSYIHTVGSIKRNNNEGKGEFVSTLVGKQHTTPLFVCATVAF